MSDQAPATHSIPAVPATYAKLYSAPHITNMKFETSTRDVGTFIPFHEIPRRMTETTTPVLSIVYNIDPVAIMRHKGSILGLKKGFSPYSTEGGYIVFAPEFNYGETTPPRGRCYGDNYKFFGDSSKSYPLSEMWVMAIQQLRPLTLITQRQRQASTALTDRNAEETTCPVCLDDFTEKPKATCKNQHQICIDCYTRLTGRKSCPVCREPYDAVETDIISKVYKFDAYAPSRHQNALIQEAQFIYYFTNTMKNMYGSNEVESNIRAFLSDTILYWSEHNEERGSYEGSLLTRWRTNYSVLAIDASGEIISNPVIENLYDYFISEENRKRLSAVYQLVAEYEYSEQRFLNHLKDYVGSDNMGEVLLQYSDRRKEYLRRYIYIYYNISQMSYETFKGIFKKIHKKMFDLGATQTITISS